MKQWKKICAAALTMMLACTGVSVPTAQAAGSNCGGLEEKDVYIPEEGDVIPDPDLHWAVRSAMSSISRKKEDKLTKEDVASKYVQYISYELSNHPDNFSDWKMPWRVESLEGLQYAKNLKMLDVGYAAITGNGIVGLKKIKSLDPIAELTQLQQLLLMNDGLDDVSALKKLTNLVSLDLHENEIQDISPLQDMVNLQNLNLEKNKISDISYLADMTQLETLNLSRNQISQLPSLEKLKKLTVLSVSDNQISDVSEIAKLRTLQSLDITGNNNIQDIKALAVLTNLDESKTMISNAEWKKDLFAAIAVNKSMEEYSVSYMSEDNAKAVKRTLEMYDALTDAQKEYIDAAKIQAIKANFEKVSNGEEPDAYPNYDAVRAPIWDRLEIKVVRKDGSLAKGVKFNKTLHFKSAEDSDQVPDNVQELSTDDNGILTVLHSSLDQLANIITITPADQNVITTPEEINYSVSGDIKTNKINGKKATGVENLKFMIRDYEWEKADAILKSALEKAENADKFRYTEESFAEFTKVYEEAKEMSESRAASADSMKSMAEKLEQALSEIVKTDILTTIKINIRDINGNPVARKFKFQIRKVPVDRIGWNEWTEEETSTAYIKASPGWTKDQKWQIIPCQDEAYSMTPIIVTTDERDGDWYFKTIDGKDADINYEITATVIPKPEGAANKSGEIQPDGELLKKTIKAASKHKEQDYSARSYARLKNAIDKGTALLNQEFTTQEMFNAAVADVKKAEQDLVESGIKNEYADVVREAKEVKQTDVEARSWQLLQNALKLTENASESSYALIKEKLESVLAELRPDKTDLKAVIDEADKLDVKKYTETSVNVVNTVLKDAKAVFADEKSGCTAVAEAERNLKNTLAGLRASEDSKSDDKEREPETILASGVSLADGSYVYDGKEKKPAVTVRNKAGQIVENSNYSVAYATGRKHVGQYEVKVTFNGDYAGTVTKTFEIVPKGTKLKSVKAGKKKFTAKWSKQKNQTNGYQLQYTTDKAFKNSVKTATVAKNSSVSRSVKKLSSKKTYYVRIRTYKNVKINGKTVKIFSAWSGVKKVKVK